MQTAVAAGEEITVTLEGSTAYGWSHVSVEGQLSLLQQAESEGTVTARVLAVAPGAGEVRSSSSFRGDRFGPHTRLWRLRVEVTGRQ